ncbi:peptidase M64 [bacterium]|nr:peptidase M64 [bacterium]
MSLKSICIFVLLTVIGLSAAAPHFDLYFHPRTMRLDYIHSGTGTTESFSFDDVYEESVWAGPVTRLIDDSNLGKYLFQVFDERTGTLIYSRGFCSIFGEWQTTEEAQKINRSFSESIRFPWPRAGVKVTISTRNRENQFIEIWSVSLNPGEVNYRRNGTYSNVPVTPLFISGDIRNKIDIVILPDGYTKDQMKKFHQDAKRLVKTLFSTEPFLSGRDQFNVRCVDLPSNEEGIDDPQKTIYRDNALACSYNAFGSDRYILTYDNKTLRKIAARVPYEHVCILVNAQKYGGGGIFNLYTTCISDNEWSDYIFVHEFGHSFGGLGDEYYTSDVAYSEFYPQDVEPWEPNLTICTDPDRVKWREMIEPGTPVPTPWGKAEYDARQTAYMQNRKELKANKAPLSEIDRIRDENDRWIHDFLRNQPYWGKTGVYEGAGYASSGLFRPYIDCRMFSRSLTGFDPVCSRAIGRMIELYTE